MSGQYWEDVCVLSEKSNFNVQNSNKVTGNSSQLCKYTHGWRQTQTVKIHSKFHGHTSKEKSMRDPGALRYVSPCHHVDVNVDFTSNHSHSHAYTVGILWCTHTNAFTHLWLCLLGQFDTQTTHPLIRGRLLYHLSHGKASHWHVGISAQCTVPAQ